MKKFYIFDLDDTLRLGVNGKFVRAGKFEYQVPLPRVVEKMRELVKESATLFIATNQGFPSFGKTPELMVWKNIIYFTDVVLGGAIKDIRLDFYHPDGPMKDRYVNRRKPKPDLLLELMTDYQIKKENAVFIGNAQSDKTAASIAEIEFIWAHDFFEWNKEDLFLNEPYGYGWKTDRLKEAYSADIELLSRLNKFLELSEKA